LNCLAVSDRAALEGILFWSKRELCASRLRTNSALRSTTICPVRDGGQIEARLRTHGQSIVTGQAVQRGKRSAAVRAQKIQSVGCGAVEPSAPQIISDSACASTEQMLTRRLFPNSTLLASTSVIQ